MSKNFFLSKIVPSLLFCSFAIVLFSVTGFKNPPESNSAGILLKKDSGTCIDTTILFTKDLSGIKNTVRTPLAQTPPMGWNSWNWFGKKLINEKVVIEVIDAIVHNGLHTAGYNYIVVDGGWRDTALSAKGELLAHTVKFPRGMKFLADYAHSKGLKFGLHTVPGTHDCGGDRVGGYGNEEVQLQQFIDWGVDFIKLDKCRMNGGWNDELLKDTYMKWSNLIKSKKADIVLSISAYAFYDWNLKVGQMGRTTEDISTIAGGLSGCKAVFDDSINADINKWNLLTVMQIADENNKWAKYAGPGYWNDPDMLVTGEQGLTAEEQKSHFALWCIMSAPLMLGNDPRYMTQQEKDIVMNKDCIMIDQDPAEQGKRVKSSGSSEIWIKKLSNGKVAALLLNRNKNSSKTIRLDFSDAGINGNAAVKEVYSKKEAGIFKNSFSRLIPPRAGLLIILQPD